MFFADYERIIRALMEYPEFRIALELCRGVLYALIIFIAVLVLFHLLYFLGQRSPLYRKRPPIQGWQRRFFGAISALFVIVLLLAWGVSLLLAI